MECPLALKDKSSVWNCFREKDFVVVVSVIKSSGLALAFKGCVIKRQLLRFFPTDVAQCGDCETREAKLTITNQMNSKANTMLDQE